MNLPVNETNFFFKLLLAEYDELKCFKQTNKQKMDMCSETNQRESNDYLSVVSLFSINKRCSRLVNNREMDRNYS